jgi:hypothetical protein
MGGCFDSVVGAAGKISPVTDHEYGPQVVTTLGLFSRYTVHVMYLAAMLSLDPSFCWKRHDTATIDTFARC